MKSTKKQNMIVISGLFFNKKGNQSMLNSIKGYLLEYDVLLITAASIHEEVYLSIEEAKNKLPNLKILNVWPKFFQRSSWKKRTEPTTENISESNSSELLINTNTNLVTQIAFYIRSIILFITALFFVLYRKPNVICAYEVNALPANKWLKIISPSLFSFAKFQGTALGFALHKIHTPSYQQYYKLDLIGMRQLKYIDCAIMTNDGTKGDKVLEHFGMAKDQILLIPNGIDDRFERVSLSIAKMAVPRQKKIINSLSVSRLTPWKRVDLIINSISILVNGYGFKDIHHTIVGIGSNSEQKLIENLIKSKGLSEYIVYAGSADTDQVIEYLSNTDLFISLNKFTNISNPVFEAISLYIPVLTIFQFELIEILGSLSNECFFIKENENDDEMSKNVAQTLISITMNDLDNRRKNLINCKKSLYSWRERNIKELNFIQENIANKIKIN